METTATPTPSLEALFPDLEPELYEELYRHGTVREVPAGTTLLRIGQPIRSALLVLEGTVKLYQEDDEGGEFFIYHLEPGQACAATMICSFRLETSQVLARTLTTATILSIPLVYMDQWMARYRSWHYFVVRSYRSKYMELLNTLNEVAFRSMDERLEFYLLKQVKQLGRVIRLTHQEIATDLNSSREVISRLLKKMEKNGWIVLHRNSLEWVRP